MEDVEPPAASISSLLLNTHFLFSRKGLLVSGEVVSSLLMFVCLCCSSSVVFITAPLLFFLTAIGFFFFYSSKLNMRYTSYYWPLADFLRCVCSSLIIFIVSITTVSKYPDPASKAAGVLGFVATVIFSLDFYFIFNQLTTFLKRGGNTDTEHNTPDGDSDSD